MARTRYKKRKINDSSTKVIGSHSGEEEIRVERVSKRRRKHTERVEKAASLVKKIQRKESVWKYGSALGTFEELQDVISASDMVRMLEGSSTTSLPSHSMSGKKSSTSALSGKQMTKMRQRMRLGFKERTKFERKIHDPHLNLSRIAHRLSLKLGSSASSGGGSAGVKGMHSHGSSMAMDNGESGDPGLEKKEKGSNTRRGIKVNEEARARRAAILEKKKKIQAHSSSKRTSRESRRRSRRERDFTEWEDEQDEMLFGGIPDEIMMMKKPEDE